MTIKEPSKINKSKYKVVNEEGMTLWFFRIKYAADQMVREMNKKFPGREFRVESVTN